MNTTNANAIVSLNEAINSIYRAVIGMNDGDAKDSLNKTVDELTDVIHELMYEGPEPSDFGPVE